MVASSIVRHLKKKMDLTTSYTEPSNYSIQSAFFIIAAILELAPALVNNFSQAPTPAEKKNPDNTSSDSTKNAIVLRL